MKNQYNVHYSRHEYREEYLKTDEWRAKSRLILERDKTCRICEKSKASDSHHLTYENLPFEDLDNDIIGVCRACHNKIHSWEVTARCREIRYIRKFFWLMNQKIKVSPSLVTKMNSLNINAKKFLSGLFKKNLHDFDEFIGVRLPFRKYLKIKDFIKRFENKEMPRYLRNERHTRNKEYKKLGLPRSFGKIRRTI